MTHRRTDQGINQELPITITPSPVSKLSTNHTRRRVDRGTQTLTSVKDLAELLARPAENTYTARKPETQIPSYHIDPFLSEEEHPLSRRESENQQSNQTLETVQHGLLKKPSFKNLTFDGSPNSDVHDFIFKLEKLSEISGFESKNISALIFDYVTGEALDFIWDYCKGKPEATWDELKSALTSWFGGRGSDWAIRKQLTTRVQSSTESIRTFILNMKKINFKLKKPYPKEELLDLIKENMRMEYRFALISAEIRTFDHLKQLGEECEHLWNANKDPKKPNGTNLTKTPKEDIEQENEDGVISEASIKKLLSTVDKISKQSSVCFNCNEHGHQYRVCSQPKTREFCFGCGKVGVRRLNCCKCNKKKFAKQI